MNRPAGPAGSTGVARSVSPADPGRPTNSADLGRPTGPAESERAARKDEHLELAVRLHGADRPSAFDDLTFVHHALPGIGTEAVDMSTTVCGARWDVPFYINAMRASRSPAAPSTSP